MSQNFPSSDFEEKPKNRGSLPLFNVLLVPLLLVVVGGLGLLSTTQQHSAASAAAATSGCKTVTVKGAFSHSDIRYSGKATDQIRTTWCWNGKTITSRSWTYSWTTSGQMTFRGYAYNNPSQCTFDSHRNALRCKESSYMVFQYRAFLVGDPYCRIDVDQTVRDNGTASSSVSVFDPDTGGKCS